MLLLIEHSCRVHVYVSFGYVGAHRLILRALSLFEFVTFKHPLHHHFIWYSLSVPGLQEDEQGSETWPNWYPEVKVRHRPRERQEIALELLFQLFSSSLTLQLIVDKMYVTKIVYQPIAGKNHRWGLFAIFCTAEFTKILIDSLRPACRPFFRHVCLSPRIL